MSKQYTNAQWRLSILYDIGESDHIISHSYFVSVFRASLHIDLLLAQKLYGQFILPRLIELIHSIHIFSIPKYVPEDDGWILKLTKRGGQHLYQRFDDVRPLLVLAATQLNEYKFQQHFLNVLDNDFSLPHYNQVETEETPIDQLLDASDEFDPEELADERKRVLAQITQRQGQAEFRAALLDLYDYRCAISGCDAIEALEAAHINPYKGVKSNRLSNGLILRADLHNLFDLGLLILDAGTLTVQLAPVLLNTTYAEFNNAKVSEPARAGYRINRKALELHQQWAQKNGKWQGEKA